MSKQQNRRNNFGWLLWVAALIFVQVACGIELTNEEKTAIAGSYLQCGSIIIDVHKFSIDNHSKVIKMTGLRHGFNFEKHTDEENLNKFSTSLKAEYYLKNQSDDAFLYDFLVVMSDGSMQCHSKTMGLRDVLYKFENIQKETKMSSVYQMILEKSDAVANMIKSLSDNQIENLANEMDDFLGEDFRRISILNAKTTSSALENLKQKLPIIICCIVLIIIVFFLFLQCCRSPNEPNIENISIEQLKTNDFSDYYPSSTDLVIDVQEMETPMQSIQANINLSDSITSVSSGNMKISSSNLFTIKSIGSEEIHELKSMQTIETNSNQSGSITTLPTTDIEKNSTDLTPSESADLSDTKPKTTHSESIDMKKNTKDTDDFTI